MSKRSVFRRKIKQQDEFVSATGRITQYVRDNPKRTGVYVGSVILVLLLAWGAGRYLTWRSGNVLKLDGEASALFDAAKQDPAKIPQAVGKLEALYDAYPGYMSGQAALYQAASLYFQQGDFRKAEEKFKLLSDKHADNELIYPLVLRNLAYLKEQAGDYPSAIAGFEKLQSVPSEVPKVQILVDLGRLNEKAGNVEKSKSSYKEIINTYPDSPYADMAREKLGLPPEKKDKGNT